jgi:hypothetical protein
MAFALLCTALAATPAVGPLRVHPGNPRYFTDGMRPRSAMPVRAPVICSEGETKGMKMASAKIADGSLKAVYLTGSHHWMCSRLEHLQSWLWKSVFMERRSLLSPRWW